MCRVLRTRLLSDREHDTRKIDVIRWYRATVFGPDVCCGVTEKLMVLGRKIEMPRGCATRFATQRDAAGNREKRPPVLHTTAKSRRPGSPDQRLARSLRKAVPRSSNRRERERNGLSAMGTHASAHGTSEKRHRYTRLRGKPTTSISAIECSSNIVTALNARPFTIQPRSVPIFSNTAEDS